MKKNNANIDMLLNKEVITIVDGGCAGGIDDIFTDLIYNTRTKCIGFEPSIKQFKKLVKPNERTTFYNMALNDRDGDVTFYEEQTLGSIFRRKDREQSLNKEFNKTTVKCCSLDTMRENQTIFNPIDVLKLDIEGAEYAAVQGAKNTIKNETLCIKSEFLFHSKLETNNFAELHLNFIDKGFQLMGLTFSDGILMGINGGDALYIKRPEIIVSSTKDTREAKKKLIKLALICDSLRLYEMIALISSIEGIFNSLEKNILLQYAQKKTYLPNLFSRSFPKLSYALFALSQVAAGQKSHSKSSPKFNRLRRLNPLFISTKMKWASNKSNNYLENRIKHYKNKSQHR